MLSRSTRPALLLFILAFLCHAPALLGVLPGALPSTGDTLGAFAPWHKFVRRELLARGAIPLWNPHLYAGVPFAANGQSGLFYPPNTLHFLLPEGAALWLFALLHTYFLMLGALFLGRTLGLSTRASFLVAVLLGWGNATPAHLFGGHLTFLPTRAFWPWQAAFLLRLLSGDDRHFDAKNALGLAACLALGLAAGAPQMWLFGVLFCLAIFGVWVFQTARNRVSPALWPWKSAVLALGLTVLWCAPVLLPLRELKNWSSHGETLSFAEVTGLSATLRSLFRLLFNNFFGGNSFFMWSLPSNPGEDAASIGLAGLCLAFMAPFTAPRSRTARALFAGCVGCVLLALGSATPLYGWLYGHVGLFRITRVPARWLELWAFGAAISAGIGFDALWQRPQMARRVVCVWAGTAGASLLLAAGVWWSQTPWQRGALVIAGALNLPANQLASIAQGLQSDALIACGLAALPLGLLARFWTRGLGSRRGLALILGLICAEPLLNFWLGVRIAPAENVRQAQVPPSIAKIYRAGERWIVRAPFQQLNAPLSAGIDALNGYEPFGSAPFFEFAAAAQPGAQFGADFQPHRMAPLWRVMGATHVLWKPKSAGEELRGFSGQTLVRAGEWRLHSIEDGLQPWPRSYLTRDFYLADFPGAWKSLQKLAVLPRTSSFPVVMPRDFSSSQVEVLENPAPPDEQFQTLRSQIQTPDVRTWRLSTTRATIFVENETLAPGWKAYVDEKPTGIYLANAIFRGVRVPAGARQIALVFDSQTLRFGLFLAFCGLGGGAFFLSANSRKIRCSPRSQTSK